MYFVDFKQFCSKSTALYINLLITSAYFIKLLCETVWLLVLLLNYIGSYIFAVFCFNINLL